MTEKVTPLGTEYGKHYVTLELLNKDSIVYSFGIGEDISFDLEIINRIGCNIWGFDPTPKAKKYIEHNSHPNFHFYDYGISTFDGNLSFQPPANPNHASYKEDPAGIDSFPVKKLSTILKELNHTTIDALKFDIEGSEYTVLENILKEGIFPVQMSIEFHGSNKNIVEWLKSNTILKEKYTGLSYPNGGDCFLDTFFLRRDKI
jgi:FkbM family methyltransferase